MQFSRGIPQLVSCQLSFAFVPSSVWRVLVFSVARWPVCLPQTSAVYLALAVPGLQIASVRGGCRRPATAACASFWACAFQLPDIVLACSPDSLDHVRVRFGRVVAGGGLSDRCAADRRRRAHRRPPWVRSSSFCTCRWLRVSHPRGSLPPSDSVPTTTDNGPSVGSFVITATSTPESQSPS